MPAPMTLEALLQEVWDRGCADVSNTAICVGDDAGGLLVRIGQALAALKSSPPVEQEGKPEVTEEHLVAGRVAYLHFRNKLEGDVLFGDLTQEEQEDLVSRIYLAMRSKETN